MRSLSPPREPGASNFPFESSGVFPALSLWLIQHSAFACLLIGGYTPIARGEFMDGLLVNSSMDWAKQNDVIIGF